MTLGRVGLRRVSSENTLETVDAWLRSRRRSVDSLLR
jgi:hypothetical protein